VIESKNAHFIKLMRNRFRFTCFNQRFKHQADNIKQSVVVSQPPTKMSLMASIVVGIEYTKIKCLPCVRVRLGNPGSDNF
jgi:hypothetical protein